MKKLLGLILLFCLSFHLFAKTVEFGISGGILKYSRPSLSQRSPFYSDPRTSPKPIASVDVFLHIPHSGFSVDLGADMHDLSIKYTYTSPYFYYVGSPSSGTTSTTNLATPLVPVYLKLQEMLVDKGVLFLTAGVNAGFAIAPGLHKNCVLEATGVNAATPEPPVQTGKGLGYMAGVHFSGGCHLAKWLSLNLAFSPRYYDITETKITTYYSSVNSYNNGINNNINVNGSVALISADTYTEKIRFHTFAYPVMLGINIHL